MAHRLELAVSNAVDDVNVVSHFRDLVDSVYKVYSMSPKNRGVNSGGTGGRVPPEFWEGGRLYESSPQNLT